jgi:hypothetical protein
MCRTTLGEGATPGNLLWPNERITGRLAPPAATKPAVSDIPSILHQALAGRYVLQREIKLTASLQDDNSETMWMYCKLGCCIAQAQ